MYFLSDEERRLLVGRLLPQARGHEVHAELRGWNWGEPPLSPPYDVRLGVYEIAGKYCSTARDVYLRRVLGVQGEANRAMREGAALHKALTDLVLGAKQAIYAGGVAGCLTALADLTQADADSASDGHAARSSDRANALPRELASAGGTGSEDRPTSGFPDRSHGTSEDGRLGPDGGAELKAKVAALRNFEYHRIVGRVQETLARQPRVGTDSLVALTLPVTVEQQLDGRLLGLSSHLATDALTAFAPVVFDLKFGGRREFHRLTTTAYALVLESLHEYPVDVGCVIYVRFAGDRVLVERDLHLIDDELRQWFIDERDERMRMVAEELDPGKADDCAEDCPHAGRCRRG